MTDLKKGIRNAQEKGIDVQTVVQSYAKHLTAERRKARDNPNALAGSAPPTSYNLCVTAERTAQGVRWKSLNAPEDIGDISVTGSSFDAARNKTSLDELMRQRFRAEVASALQRNGLYQTDLAGRRAAMKVAIDSSISVVDLADVGRA